jgi:hypothetical protein
MPKAPGFHEAIQGKQHHRHKLNVLELQVRELDERMGVERGERSSQETRAPTAGPAPGQQTERPARERQSRQQNEVVGENGRPAECNHRKRHCPLYDHRF